MTTAARTTSLARIVAVADALPERVRNQVVFIGGTVLPLLVDVDARFDVPRPTFVFDQFRVLRRGIRDLHDYLARKTAEMRDTQRVLAAHWKTEVVLNQRQIALLGHALRHPQAAYTAQSHRRSHAVAYDTARHDLLELVKEGLLLMHKEGKKFVFMPAGELGRRVR